MKTNSIRSAIDGVSDIIIDTMVEEIISGNDLDPKNEPRIKNIIFKQFEEMKKRIICDLNNNQKNNQKKMQLETVITKRRIMERNHENREK